MDYDVFENGFFIPENVYIIATMNDIDRSVEAFDFALRRRFQWIEVKANDVMKDALEGMQKNNDIHKGIKVSEFVESVKH
ncbi:5-methylcytosine-specific restriction endonuclease McrBC GTP-binding regulatory subunit McrB [Peribacillus frigoritolerans]|nr:5-methylcytosine-specific restriction endonuclease McrBC GTP-binding regulatory subunit McrB [Peribacillus frigoritolerans]